MDAEQTGIPPNGRGARAARVAGRLPLAFGEPFVRSVPPLGYTQAVTPLPLRDAPAHLPHEAPQLRQLPLQVLGHVLLPLQAFDYLLLALQPR